MGEHHFWTDRLSATVACGKFAGFGGFNCRIPAGMKLPRRQSDKVPQRLRRKMHPHVKAVITARRNVRALSSSQRICFLRSSVPSGGSGQPQRRWHRSDRPNTGPVVLSRSHSPRPQRCPARSPAGVARHRRRIDGLQPNASLASVFCSSSDGVIRK